MFFDIAENIPVSLYQSPSDETTSFLPIGYSTYSYNRVDVNPTTFYFDSVLGDNTNTGISEGAPLKDLWTLDYINLVPGDNLKLKKGSVWSNNWIHITEFGTNSNHISISTYGVGDLPSITATIQDRPALYLEGKYIDVEYLLVAGTNKAAGIFTGTLSQYVTIDNCEIKNSGIGVVFRGSDHLL